MAVTSFLDLINRALNSRGPAIIVSDAEISSWATGGGVGPTGPTGGTGAAGSSTIVIGITVDGAGTALTTGLKGFRSFPVAGTIASTRLFSDQTGSVVVDIWKDTYANFPPTVADTITASAKPTLSSARSYSDAVLTGWTKSINAGDVFGFNIDSATTLTRVTLELTVTVP